MSTEKTDSQLILHVIIANEILCHTVHNKVAIACNESIRLD